ncbi:MAG TPA: tryptophan synthase subunit beta [Firmicutes bacterium]|jgi:tryptophan synthase beta chain|nr:MAG: tryptophan synthase subunit beta [Peptococcaceae bacterium 1109]HHT73172.1 tryptophan synthase subunit beta [Bacillota bacterium]
MSTKLSVEKKGFFGEFGGQYVPPELEASLNHVAEAYEELRSDPSFQDELGYYLREYSGRPTPLYHAERLSQKLGGAQIFLKREDLNHTGSHKINNVLGQALMAKRMGAKRVIAETGAGQHGVATATACALLDMECVVYMGAHDADRQRLNVFRMELLGAKVVRVTTGGQRLKEAVDAALEDFAQNYRTTFYVLGSAVGPYPYPDIVRDFQSVIGREARAQILEKTGKLPDYLVACVGGGSNAIGLFAPFYGDSEVRMVGCEPGGTGSALGQNAAALTYGVPAIIHGFKCYALIGEDGTPAPTTSIAAGLDYPGAGPEHSFYRATGRAEYVTVSDEEALDAFQVLTKAEGIIPALESAHAVAHALKLAPKLAKNQVVIVNLSGRGDKDADQVLQLLKG